MGVELLQSEPSSPSREVVGLIQTSGETLRHKLSFFRSAFGPVGTHTLSYQNVRELIKSYYSLTKTLINLPDSSLKINILKNPQVCQLVLQASLIPLEFLPRGGEVTLSFSSLEGGEGIYYKVTGKDLLITPLEEGMGETSMEDFIPTPKNILYFLTASSAQALGYKIMIKQSSDENSIVYINVNIF
jgi:hypothetical protein